MSKILLFNKPFGVLSQFTGADLEQTLAAYIQHKDFYAAGRLDKDSEGLLLLTDDGQLQQRIANPEHKQGKTYLVQVEGDIAGDVAALTELSNGVQLKDGISKPAQAMAVDEPSLWSRNPPIRQRKNIPTSWLEITLYEGRNRQVRRMTAAVGYPTLRLIRTRIAKWQLGNMQPGEMQLVDVE